MFRAYGLYTHIRANRIRSAVLLAGFVALLHALLFSVLLFLNAFGGGTFEMIVDRAVTQFLRSWPIATLAAVAWFVIAFLFHRSMISFATRSRGISRKEAPQLYNALENLCISRGITMPKLEVIETPALNAYAAGLSEGHYTVAVTRGLIDTLTPQELEAVLAHELTHIRNKDTQMMVIAVIFAGIFAFFGDMLVRGWDFPYGWSPTHRRREGGWGGDYDSHDGNRARGRDGGGGGAILAIVVAIAIILISWGVSTLIRFALSRTREYMADAGAVELTKNPDAMISALEKIGRQAVFEAPSRMEAFFIESPVKNRMMGLFDTHPAIEDRVAAIRRFAGAAGALTTS